MNLNTYSHELHWQLDLTVQLLPGRSIACLKFKQKKGKKKVSLPRSVSREYASHVVWSPPDAPYLFVKMRGIASCAGVAAGVAKSS